ncbi:MAG: 4Fe-4S binding protein [Methanomicrobiales archaeon]|nr:4Fe-4S binding protein [Methanomicrobiales archaeon]
MQITRSSRRTIAGIILTAGLAYPACAAVCPKGIGGCTSPGRCFLFIDADANSLCDYTVRTGSTSATGSIPSRPIAPSSSSAQVSSQVSSPGSTSVQPAATTVPDPAITSPVSSGTITQGYQASPAQETTTAITTGTTQSGSYDLFSLSGFLTELVVFLLFTGIIFSLVRSGRIGIRVERTLPALALSSLFGLGLSLITMALVTGTTASGTSYALVYITAGTLLAAYLWHSGVMTRGIILGTAALGTLAGFVFLAPIMPQELGGLVNVLTGASSLTAGVIVICALILLALLFGRVFCGNICPVGSLQELAFSLPLNKVVVRRNYILELIRLLVFVATVAAAVYLIDILAITGLYDLFALTLTAGTISAAALIILSVFVYRPICRILCPFGVLFALFAEFSIFGIRRTGSCISCKKCEIACPARTAGRNDSKRECYLCGRCTGTCPVPTALAYRR